MIVCICNNISDREIRQAVRQGLTTMTGLRQELGVATCCGKCHSCAKQVLQECMSEPPASASSRQIFEHQLAV